MSENPEVLQQLFASEIGHTIIITPKNGEQFRGILLAVGPSFVTVKKSASRKNIFFDQIADWEVLDEEPTPVALPAGDQNGTRQNGAGSASPLQQHEAVFQLPVQSQPLYAETSPQPLPPQWSPPTAQPEPSTQKANEHAILLDAQIQAQLALIDARLTGKITGASIDILPPDFALAKEELKTQASKSAWDSIRQKYMYALNNNELGSQFGRVKPLISSLKTLIQQVPTSAGLRRHLAYLYYITGDVDDAFLSYKETCLLSPTPADWHNAAVLARRKPETEVLAYYILPQIFKQHAITDHMVAWFVFIGLAKQFTDASPLRDIYETSSRTLSEDEEQLLVDASIYLFKHFDKEELTQKLAQGLLEHKPCHELLQEASRHFMAMEVNVYQRQQLLWREARQQLLGLGQSVARQSTAQSTGTATVWSATAVGGNKKQTHRGGIYSYKKSQNYGFIIGDDGKDYFFHRSAVNDEELLTQLQRFTEERIALKDALPVTFEPTVGERGYLAMNVSSFLDIHEMFKAANNYANEGEYTKAVNQIKKVLAQDMVYPQAQELLEKWREYARASSVPRGTTPYPRAKRKQLIERDLEGAIPIFYEAIRQNDTVESAVKDLASLLMQLGKSAEAITVLNQNRHLATDQQRINNLLIDAYQKNGQYELAIGLLKQTLKTATTTNKKAQLSWRVGGCYMAQKDYLNAEYWFREVIALGQDNKSAQRNLAFCLIQLKRNEEAEQILTANLPDPQSAELLQAIVTARVTGETVNIPDFSGDMTSEISVFTRFFLDRCSYEGVPLNRVQQKNFEQADVRILEELASRLGTRRPRERAEYYLSAAKIILEHDEWDEYNQLYRYLCRSFASRGDAAIIESKPPDTAREWYCEALCVYDGDRGRTRDEQDAINALICFLFATFGRNNVPTSVEERKNIKIDDSLRQVLQQYAQPEKAFDAIAYLVSRSQFAADRILTRLYASQQLLHMALRYLERRGIPVQSTPTSLPQFSELWKPLRLKEIEKVSTISIELRSVARVELKEASVEESLKRLQVIEPNLFFDLDKQRIIALRKILGNMLDLCHQSIFEERERFCTQIDNLCKDLLRQIETNPTKLSVEDLYPIVKAIEEKTLKYLDEIYIASVPQLTLRLPDDFTSYYTPDVNSSRIEMQIVIGNKSGCSPAEAVELIVARDEADAFLVEDPEIKLDGSLRGGEQRIQRVPIRVTEQAIKSQAFSVSMYAQYRTRSDDIAQTEVFSFSINLYSDEKFARIDNPYAAYAQGNVVGDESMFYGRHELITNIAEAIYAAHAQSKAIVIFGQKRSGKSSILFHLEKKLHDYAELLVVDLGNIGGYLDPNTRVPLLYQLLWGILSKLIHAIEDEEDQGRPPLGLAFPNDLDFYDHPTPVSRFKELLIQFKRATSRTYGWHSKRIVLLIDEFSYLYGLIVQNRLPDEEFMKIWKSLLQDELFSAVLAGQDVMPKFKERFPNEFGIVQDQRVSYLKSEDAVLLIDEPIRIGGKTGKSRYREKAIERIVDLTAGSPFYIQIICHRLVEYMNRKRTSLVTEADVEQVKNELITGANLLGWDKFDNLISSGDTSPDAISSEEAKVILKIIARNYRTGCNRNNIVEDPTITDNPQIDVDKILEDLEKREVIEVKSGQYYTIRVGLFRDWLLAH